MDELDLREKWADALMGLVMASRILDIVGVLTDRYDLESDPEIRTLAEGVNEDALKEGMKNAAMVLFEIEKECTALGVDLIHLVHAGARRMDPWYLPIVLELRHTVRAMEEGVWFATATTFSRRWVKVEREYEHFPEG